MTPREAFLGPQEIVPAEEAVGRVAAESLAAYPPGIPNVLPGERLPQRRSTTSARPSRTAAACAARATASCGRCAWRWSAEPARGAQATRSRLSACIRQCAPPPPSVNAASSGS